MVCSSFARLRVRLFQTNLHHTLRCGNSSIAPSTSKGLPVSLLTINRWDFGSGSSPT